MSARLYTFADALGPPREILPGRGEAAWRALLDHTAVALRLGSGSRASLSLVEDIETSGYGYSRGYGRASGRQPYPSDGSGYPPPAEQCWHHPHQRRLYRPAFDPPRDGRQHGSWWCPWCAEAEALAADRRAAGAAEDRLAFWPR